MVRTKDPNTSGLYPSQERGSFFLNESRLFGPNVGPHWHSQRPPARYSVNTSPYCMVACEQAWLAYCVLTASNGTKAGLEADCSAEPRTLGQLKANAVVGPCSRVPVEQEQKLRV